MDVLILGHPLYVVLEVLWCAWVWVKGFFDPTHYGELQKFNLIQPNPTYMGWTTFFFFF